MDAQQLERIGDTHTRATADLDGAYRWMETVYQDYPALLRAIELHNGQFELVARLAVDTRTFLEEGAPSRTVYDGLTMILNIATSALGQRFVV